MNRRVYMKGCVCAKSLQPYPSLCHPTRILCPWGFSKQEYWSGLPWPPPEDLPDPGIKPTSLTSLALAGRFFTTSTTTGNVIRAATRA